MSTDKFLLALKRFISLFGQPTTIYSDNGSNFVGAAREIKDMINRWKTKCDDGTKLNDFCAQHSIEWKFSTPCAPHHNGAIESMVKSVKSSLNKTVKTFLLTEEEYRTLFAEITASINSRPLWVPTEGDIDHPPITCQDLI